MINTLGPFLVTQAFLPLIRKGSKKQVTPRSHCTQISGPDLLIMAVLLVVKII